MTHGLPQTIVSDNHATSFTSVDFHHFVQENGVDHITSTPYHPPSNGLAERDLSKHSSKVSKGSEKNLRKQDVSIPLSV